MGFRSARMKRPKHGQLGVGGPTAQDLPDPLVLVILETQLVERLWLVGSGCGVLDGVDRVGVRARHADSLGSAVKTS